MSSTASARIDRESESSASAGCERALRTRRRRAAPSGRGAPPSTSRGRAPCRRSRPPATRRPTGARSSSTNAELVGALPPVHGAEEGAELGRREQALEHAEASSGRARDAVAGADAGRSARRSRAASTRPSSSSYESRSHRRRPRASGRDRRCSRSTSPRVRPCSASIAALCHGGDAGVQDGRVRTGTGSRTHPAGRVAAPLRDDRVGHGESMPAESQRMRRCRAPGALLGADEGYSTTASSEVTWKACGAHRDVQRRGFVTVQRDGDMIAERGGPTRRLTTTSTTSRNLRVTVYRVLDGELGFRRPPRTGTTSTSRPRPRSSPCAS